VSRAVFSVTREYPEECLLWQRSVHVEAEEFSIQAEECPCRGRGVSIQAEECPNNCLL
jgi:hypothetical protein